MTGELRPLPMYHAGNPVPYCTQADGCYDGKRCKLTGFRPDVMCEPAVRELLEAKHRKESA